jgi:hypothetical protein
MYFNNDIHLIESHHHDNFLPHVSPDLIVHGQSTTSSLSNRVVKLKQGRKRKIEFEPQLESFMPSKSLCADPIAISISGGDDNVDDNTDGKSSKLSNTTNQDVMNPKLKRGAILRVLSQDESTSSIKSETESTINDRRKLNKGLSQRKSYPKEVKKRAIALRDSGLSVDDVAKILDTAKSNIEKWCSVKVSFIFTIFFYLKVFILIYLIVYLHYKIYL